MGGTRLCEDLPGRLGVAAGNKDQLQTLDPFLQQIGQPVHSHICRLALLVLEEQVVALLVVVVDPMAAEVQDLQSLLDPEVQFIDGGRLVDVVDFTLALLEGLLDDLFLLEIVDLLLDFPAFVAEEGLAEHEEEGGGDGLGLALAVAHFGPVQKLRHYEAEGVV